MPYHNRSRKRSLNRKAQSLPLLLAWSLLICILPGVSTAADRYVSSTGRNFTSQGFNNTCQEPVDPCRTIQHAIDEASDMDVIKVQSGGEYIEHLSMVGFFDFDNLTIQGGWEAGFTVWREDHPARINGGESGRILKISNYSAESTVSLQSLTFYHGAVEGNGGAILFEPAVGTKAELSIESCDFIENTSTTRGGAISIENHGADMTVSIEKSLFFDNSTSGAMGGAIAHYDHSEEPSRLNLTNNIIVNNEGHWGGGIAISGIHALVELLNNTVAENTAFKGGSLAVISKLDRIVTVNITNSILQDSDSSSEIFIREDDQDGNNSQANVNALYSNIGAVAIDTSAGGLGIYTDMVANVDTDSSFVNSAGGDYHLTWDSSMIDAGLCSVISFPVFFRIAPYEDFEGDSRPGHFDDLGCDIGADEFAAELSPNLITNSEFHDVDQLADWFNPSSRVSWDSLDHKDHPTSGSALLTHDLGAHIGIGMDSECILVTPGNTYELSVWVYEPNQPGSGHTSLGVRWYEDDDCSSGSFLSWGFLEGVNPPTENWTFVSENLDAPPGAVGATVRLGSVSDTEEVYLMRHDSVRFAQVPEPSAAVSLGSALATLAWLRRRKRMGA